MWSEHCSYKSSKHFLKRLPTEAPWVIQGPGENAGVIDIGDNQAAVFKMESHNHPSYIEPYQGAATGVGGILRDVFTMGARPVANLNALRFGDPTHPKTRSLVAGVVKGIGDYGNCMGVPTVGGEVNFHPRYNGNILVNAMTVGIAEQDKLFYSTGAGVDQPVVYVGSKTGRDGIHGATMASAEFDDEAEAQRPTVQVGDPFTEKLLLEACLELMQKDAIISIQDMGAAGLTSSSVEIAAKGKIGITLDLDHVPQRETNMVPYEIMLSESQERMLMILKPGKEDEAKAVFDKWDLDFAVIGRTTDTQTLVLNMYDKCWCDIPVPPLVDEAPEYKRPLSLRGVDPTIDADDFPLPEGRVVDCLKAILGNSEACSKAWIYEQYDPLVRGETKAGPEKAAAAIVKVHENGKGIVTSSDCNPRYCYADPYEGGKQAVAESWRNITACGGTPLAVTNNLNFGNPEKPEIMGEFAGAIDGMREACKTLNYPVVSGNVSLYNETNGEAILPTPVIGGVGVIDNVDNALTIAANTPDLDILVIGGAGTNVSQSLYLRHVFGAELGAPPAVDLSVEKRNGDFIRNTFREGLMSGQQYIHACQDISDGGMLTALAEMLMAGKVGADISEYATENFSAASFFGEDQSRYLLLMKNSEALIQNAEMMGIQVTSIGKTIAEPKLIITEEQTVTVDELREFYEGWFPLLMQGDKS